MRGSRGPAPLKRLAHPLGRGGERPLAGAGEASGKGGSWRGEAGEGSGVYGGGGGGRKGAEGSLRSKMFLAAFCAK